MSELNRPLNHQKNALNEITARARAYFAGHWRSLPITPRWHSLVCGPTGVGKTALAAMAADAVGASLLRISAPCWMPSGAHHRGSKESIGVISEHVYRNERTLLVIDEIDKLVDGSSGGTGGSGNDAWRSYVRGEIYDLADGRWPAGMTTPDDEDCNEIPLEIMTSKLRDSVFVLGIGTFQEWFDHSASHRTLGFGAETDSTFREISADTVARRIPRELANRFNTDLIRLPELQKEDYHRIAREAERKLPAKMQESFRAEVQIRIQGAIDNRKGVRFLEECMMQVLKKMPNEPEPSAPVMEGMS